MKKFILTASLSVFILLGAGCQIQKQEQAISLPSAVEEFQTQTVPEIEKQGKREIAMQVDQTKAGATLYRGSWFDIQYPENFTPNPITPTTIYNGQTYVQTDEAYFTSPDGAVEFFVYSPLWSGNPETYVTIAPTEEMVSQKSESLKQTENLKQFGDKFIQWTTIKAKDGSYYRSFVSIKEQIGTGSDLHHVFGIKYPTNASYEQYKEAYASFKESLRQYAD